VSGDNSLREADDRYGPVCACGARKHKAARRCLRCYKTSQPRLGFKDHETASLSDGRREALITFANADRGLTRTLQCYGDGKQEQIDYGRRHLDGDGWTVQCRSTPQSILNDLGVEKMHPRDVERRGKNMREAAEA
jgi:hypothetical protein